MNNNSISYRPEIDGIRAIAIISVLLFHLNPNFLPSGFVGVDIFFVISGFLITKIIIKEIENNDFKLSHFYIRRVRRIFPALFTTLFFCLIAAILTFGAQDLMWFLKTLRYSALQISNFLFQQKVSYFDPYFENIPLIHTWSLAVEEQFYVFFPAILIIFYKKGRNYALTSIIILSILSLILSEFLLTHHHKISFFNLSSRFWELSTGSILAFYNKNNLKKIHNEIISLLSLFFLIISLFSISEKGFPGLSALIPCLSTALLIFSNHNHKTTVTNILSNKILRYIGLISFSLYLIHYPLISFYKEYLDISQLSNLESLIIAIISFILSSISYFYIEKPFRKNRDLSTQKYFTIKNIKLYQPFIISIAVISLIITISIILKPYYKNQIDQLTKMSYIKKNNKFNDNCVFDSLDKFNQNIIKKCSYGQKPASILLIGDSHSIRYASSIIDIAKEEKESILTITSTSCQHIDLKVKKNETKEKIKICQKYQELISKLIKKESIKTVIISYRWDDKLIKFNNLNKDSIKNLKSSIKNMLNLNKNIKIIGLGPIFSFDPLKCTLRNQAIISIKRQCKKEEYIKANRYKPLIQNFFQKMTKYPKIRYFNPNDYLCDKDFCYTTINNQLYFSDYNHINLHGTNFLKKDIKKDLFTKNLQKTN